MGAATCTAPGRPGCTITCKKGECYAYYREPSGPCLTTCVLEEGNKALMLHERFSIQIHAITGRDLSEILVWHLPDSLQKRMKDSSRKTFIALQNATKKDLIEELTKIWPEVPPIMTPPRTPPRDIPPSVSA